MKEFCRLLPRVNWAYLVVVARPFSALGVSLRVCLCVGDTVIFFFFFLNISNPGSQVPIFR